MILATPISRPLKRFLTLAKSYATMRVTGGIYFAVVDNKHCVSAINVDIKRISVNEPVSLLWTDDETYADYLTATFELLWQRSIPAVEQIQKLLAQGPPKA